MFDMLYQYVYIAGFGAVQHEPRQSTAVMAAAILVPPSQAQSPVESGAPGAITGMQPLWQNDTCMIIV